MPVEWEIRGPILVLAFSGIVERDEIERALASALSDPRAGAGMGLLWDARSSQTPLSADDLNWRVGVVASLAERGQVRRTAVLLTERWSATLDYFRDLADGWAPTFPLAMFVDEGEALAWLEAED